MKTLTKILAVGCLTVVLSAQAGLVNLSTGVNPSWTLVGGTAYVAVPPGGPGTFPIMNPYWLANTPTSQWITSDRIIDLSPLGPTGNNVTYEYKLVFTAALAETGTVRWVSDNTSKLFINGVQLGSEHTGFTSWSPTYNVAFAPGTYTMSLFVTNLGQDTGGPNPNGARVELFAPVPEPATIAAGALLLLPFAASTLRRFRKS